MADLSKWDDEYEEMVLEFLYAFTQEQLVDLLVRMMSDQQVETMIDIIQDAKRG